MRKIILPLLFLFLLAGCNLPGVKPTPESKSTSLPSTQCGWNWATQSLPEMTARVEAAMQSAGLKEVMVSAEAFGENCINPAGKVDHFATMETDFHIIAKVGGLTNKNDLGNLLERILVVLDDFPAGKVPGSEPGNISISFQAGGDEFNLMFNVTQGINARAGGLHGRALIEALQNK